MIIKCPHCNNSLDVLELVYANAQAKEREHTEKQRKFDLDGTKDSLKQREG
jgi:hypothetical protein